MVCSVSKSFGSVNRRRLNSALKKTVVREPHAGNIAGRSTGKEQYTVSNLNEHFYSSRMPSNILFVFVVDWETRRFLDALDRRETGKRKVGVVAPAPWFSRRANSSRGMWLVLPYDAGIGLYWHVCRLFRGLRRNWSRLLLGRGLSLSCGKLENNVTGLFIRVEDFLSYTLFYQRNRISPNVITQTVRYTIRGRLGKRRVKLYFASSHWWQCLRYVDGRLLHFLVVITFLVGLLSKVVVSFVELAGNLCARAHTHTSILIADIRLLIWRICDTCREYTELRDRG